MLFRYDEEWGEKIEDTVEYIFLVDGQCYACGAESGAKEEKRGIEVDKHPIESLMGTTMESIREMVDVNTVVRDT